MGDTSAAGSTGSRYTSDGAGGGCTSGMGDTSATGGGGGIDAPMPIGLASGHASSLAAQAASPHVRNSVH